MKGRGIKRPVRASGSASNEDLYTLVSSTNGVQHQAEKVLPSCDWCESTGLANGRESVAV